MGTRALTARDEREVERFALMAAFAPHRPLPAGARTMGHVRRWLDGWSPHELGVCWEEHDQVVGAAWARRVEPVLVRSAIGQPVPEVLIAVDPRHRGQGTGTVLMEALIICTEEAGEPALCLSVNDQNTSAMRLYDRVGFVGMGESATRQVTMVLDLEN